MQKKAKYFEDETDPILKGELWLKDMINGNLVEDDEVVGEVFQSHPFNLPPFCRPNGSFLPIKYLKIIPSYYLVDPMAMVIARDIELGASFYGLRRIKAKCDIYEKDFHRIYCEVACGHSTYLVGHSTDYSGHGKKCKEHMDCLFAFLSDRYKLPVQEVVIPFALAVPVIRKIE